MKLVFFKNKSSRKYFIVDWKKQEINVVSKDTYYDLHKYHHLMGCTGVLVHDVDNIDSIKVLRKHFKEFTQNDLREVEDIGSVLKYSCPELFI